MKKFNIFNWNKKDKTKFSENFDRACYNDVNLSESNDSFEFKDSLDYYLMQKTNHETAEDAISIRSSVDCKNRIKFCKSGSNSLKSIIQRVGMTQNHNLSKSLKSINNSINESTLKSAGDRKSNGSSHQNHHVINHKIIQNHSKSMILFNGETPTFKHQLDARIKPLKLHDYPVTIPEDIDENTINFVKPSSIIKANRGSPIYGVTTAAILSRHESNSSTHNNTKKAWIETDNGRKVGSSLTKDEINRQNIIYEMFTTENDALDDLKRVIKNYKEPMEKLKLINQSDSFNIFYTLERLIPIYELLVKWLKEDCDSNGVVKHVGKTLWRFSDMLDTIVKYCTHLYYTKSVLEEKRKVKDIGEFLQKCSSSKFSRKLDLWDFLDSPRSRLMKYPLLIDRILKSTDMSNSDYHDLNLLLKRFEKILANLDAKTGEEMCNFYLDKIEFSEQSQYIQLVKSQKVLLLEGNLKIGRSVNFQKVHAFLFKDVLVFTKTLEEEIVERIRYVVYGNPLPTSRLVIEDIKDGELKIGSFRSTFISDRGSKNVFRLTLLSVFIPECEFEEHKNSYSLSQYSLDDMTSSSSSANQEYRLLKNSQTIVQVSKQEEKQLWFNVLKNVVAREIKGNE